MSDERKDEQEEVEAHRFLSPTEAKTHLNDTEDDDVEAHRLSSPAQPGFRVADPERRY